MPDYPAPGVFIEETSFHSTSIEGVATQTAAFVGVAAYGPVYHPNGPLDVAPRVVSSVIEFERIYGSSHALHLSPNDIARANYLAHSVAGFFANGGRRLYISRVFAPRTTVDGNDWGVAKYVITVPPATAVDSATSVTWRARWPGRNGNVSVETRITRSANVATVSARFGGIVQVIGATNGTVVEVTRKGAPPAGNAPPRLSTLAVVDVHPKTGRQSFRRRGRAFRPTLTDTVQIVEAHVLVQGDGADTHEYRGLGAHAAHPNSITAVFARDAAGVSAPGLIANITSADSRAIWLDCELLPQSGIDAATRLLVAMQRQGVAQLTGGHDGEWPTPQTLRGEDSIAHRDAIIATGLTALASIEDIAIVAAPDASASDAESDIAESTRDLIAHAESARYRVAVLDAPQRLDTFDVQRFRTPFDSTRAALYYPWLQIDDAETAQPLPVPSCGFVCGVYARTDTERGVHIAPANQPLLGIIGLVRAVSNAEQETLNPEGINVLRTITGRGIRVWGARTLSRDPEWRYVNVRRLLLYLEHSIVRGTEWVVFEPNGDALWAKVTSTIENFLLTAWTAGTLLGTTAKEAFFVQCDRRTMTQQDIDNGRLVCLIGVAPLKPAEFVIFRIGQWTSEGDG